MKIVALVIARPNPIETVNVAVSTSSSTCGGKCKNPAKRNVAFGPRAESRTDLTNVEGCESGHGHQLQL